MNGSVAVLINLVLIISIVLNIGRGLMNGNSLLSLLALCLVALIMLILPITVSKEASVVGVVFVSVGTIAAVIVGIVASLFGNNELPEACKKWNSAWTMEWSLFLAGVIGHLAFEVMGANKWYCTNGHACLV